MAVHKSETGERRVDVAEFVDWCVACGVDPLQKSLRSAANVVGSDAVRFIGQFLLQEDAATSKRWEWKRDRIRTFGRGRIRASPNSSGSSAGGVLTSASQLRYWGAPGRYLFGSKPSILYNPLTRGAALKRRLQPELDDETGSTDHVL